MSDERKKRYVFKPFRLIFIIVLLAANTFAWFIYATKIDSSVSVHVRSWNVIFEAGENEVTDMISLNVDNLYPGMDDYTYEIKAYNRSEVSATLSYVILSANILGDEYITEEGRIEAGQEIQETDLTSNELETKLANDYPFNITISTSNNVIKDSDGVETYTLGAFWPYENNHDDLDTSWGINAYHFKENNPTLPSISLRIKIIITQNLN